MRWERSESTKNKKQGKKDEAQVQLKSPRLSPQRDPVGLREFRPQLQLRRRAPRSRSRRPPRLLRLPRFGLRRDALNPSALEQGRLQITRWVVWSIFFSIAFEYEVWHYFLQIPALPKDLQGDVNRPLLTT